MKKMVVYGMVTLSILAFFSFTGDVFAEDTGINNWVLMFQVLEYNKRIGDAADYFLKEVLKPEDNLLLFTPQRHYNFSQKTRQTNPLEKLIQITKDVLKRDIFMAASAYNDIIRQMEVLVRTFTDPDSTQQKHLTSQYRQLKENLFAIRKLNEKLFLDLAAMFKQAKGKNHIIIFYEKRMRVIPNRQTMDRLRADPEVRYDINEVLEAESAKEVMNVNAVIQALKDAGAKLHFVYLNTKVRRSRDMELREFSGDIYNAFSKIAKETGGTVRIASRAEAGLKEILGGKK
ncbi:MAG: hypothetical protein PVH61_16800 [Candidatus Aminicenantes bacterium]